MTYDIFGDISETQKVRDDAYSQSYDRHVRRKFDHSKTQFAHITYDPHYQSHVSEHCASLRTLSNCYF